MRIQILASGSKGNATLIESDTTKLLIDMGISYKQLSNRLKEVSKDPSDIDAVVITHTHSDHISGLSSLVAKTGVKVLSIAKNCEELNKTIAMENIEIVNASINLGDINISMFNLSHDVPVVGLIIKNKDKEVVYITDTGYINKKHIASLKNKDVYIIESNFDEEMLLNGPYPFVLQQRVIGDSGHLSNSDTAKFLKKVIGEKTKHIFLAHISENNNTPALAYQTVSDAIEDVFSTENLYVANQHEISQGVVI